METHWDFWAWTAYCSIFIAAIILAADAALRTAPELRARLEWLTSAKLWSFAPVSFLIISLLIVVSQAAERYFKGSARLELHRSFISATTDPVWINYYYQNTGKIPAIGARKEQSSSVVDVQKTSAELDMAFNALRSAVDLLDSKKIEAEIQPNAVQYFTFRDQFPKQEYDQIIRDGKFLYLFFLAKYRDRNLGPGKWRISEYCRFLSKDAPAFHVCDRHNRIFESE